MYLEVYPDVIFILNFIFDIILLYLLKKINRKNSKILRIVLGAAVGAVSATIAGMYPFIPALLKIFILNVVGATLMIIIAFGPLKLFDLTKQFIVLNLITYFVGGLMNSVYYHTGLRLLLIAMGNGTMFSNISLGYVIAAILIIASTVLLALRLYPYFHNNAPETYEVELVMEDRSITTKGLMDTGNCLYDPIYRRPVMVLENSLMSELLSPGFCKDLEEAKHYLEINNLDTTQWSVGDETLLRLRFIPYRSVGKSGVLLGFKLDKVLIHTGKETICNEKVIVAFSDNRLSNKEEYHAILHKALL